MTVLIPKIDVLLSILVLLLLVSLTYPKTYKTLRFLAKSKVKRLFSNNRILRFAFIFGLVIAFLKLVT